MKVSISYNIDFEDVPQEGIKAIDDAGKAHESALMMYGKARDLMLQENLTLSAKEIEKTRIALSKIDNKLNDCTNIILGYQRALIDLQTEPPAQSSAQPNTPAPTETEEENEEG